MKFCQHCGKQLLDEAVICPVAVAAVPAAANAAADEVNIGFVILSVLIPLFGLIYWAINAKTYPKRARACGIAAIIAFALASVSTLPMILTMVS